MFRRNSVYDEVPHSTNTEVDYMSFDRISITVQFLEQKTDYRPKIAIICGSGLGRKLSLKYKIAFRYLKLSIFAINKK